MIDLQEIQKMKEMKEKEKIIADHSYKIYLGKDGYWYTYLKDPSTKTGRRKIKKKTEEQIKECIVESYKNAQKISKKENIFTLKNLYDEWIDFKTSHTNAMSYIKRIHTDWKKFYQDISQIDIKKMDAIFLDKWIHDTIKKYSLNKKQFYNMFTILKQCFEYAYRKDYISENPINSIEINKKMFSKIIKPQSNTQVFNTIEEPTIENYCIEKFNETKDTGYLGIYLTFKTGLRIGELSALKIVNIHDKYISVCNEEVAKFEKKENGDYIQTGYEIVDHTKTDNGIRNVYITTKTKKIIDTIILTNKRKGFWKSEYLFVDDNGERIRGYTFRNKLSWACRVNGFDIKGMHKIRKTYISTLIDANVNINTIRELVGHADERTTLRNYCFDRSTKQEIEEKLENALTS